MAAIAKTRSRRGGSAVPLDETDRKLLNLLQGSFPLAERPYAEVALGRRGGEHRLHAERGREHERRRRPRAPHRRAYPWATSLAK